MKHRYYKFGYCGMTADFLHVGHIEFLKACKEYCEFLIVGIMADDCVKIYKGKPPIMNQVAREEVVKSLSMVHKTVIQTEFKFPHFVMRLKEFYGDDFVIIDSDENAKLRKGAGIIIPGGINRKWGMSSTLFKGSL